MLKAGMLINLGFSVTSVNASMEKDREGDLGRCFLGMLLGVSFPALGRSSEGGQWLAGADVERRGCGSIAGTGDAADAAAAEAR